jgi:hypothetical protein
MRQDRADELRMWAAAILVYIATSVFYFVVPLGKHFGERLLGTALFPADPILNAGILEWGYRTLWTPGRHIFEWTAGFPLHDSLAGTENLIGWQLFYTPLRLLCGNVAAYNVCLVLSFILSGVGTLLLARRLGVDRCGSVVAGFIFAFVPFHLNHVIHVQTMAVCYCPFVLCFLDRYLSRASFGRSVPLGLAYVMTALSSAYFGLFLLFVMPLYAVLCWLLGRYPFRFRTLGGLLATGLVSAALLIPVALPYLRFGKKYGYDHPPATLILFSLELPAVIKLPFWVALQPHRPPTWRSKWTPAFPGVAASLLALTFLLKRPAEKEPRRVKLILVILALTSFLLSLGPVLKLHPYEPIWSTSWIPMPGKIFMLFSAIRWPMRIAFFSFLAGAILSGLGFSTVSRRWSPMVRFAAGGLVVLLLFFEYRPRAYYASHSKILPAPLAVSEAYSFLAAETDRGAIAEAPAFDLNDDPAPYSARYIYGSAGHLRRVIAFHGTVRPSPLDELAAATEELPSEASCRFLTERGVTRVVIHDEHPFKDSRPLRREELIRAGYRPLFQSAHAAVFALENPCPTDDSRTQ